MILDKALAVGFFTKNIFDGTIPLEEARTFLGKYFDISEYVIPGDTISEKAGVPSTPPALLPSGHFKYDLTKEGWTLESDGGAIPSLDLLGAIELVPIYEKGEAYSNGINGDVLTKRAKMANANLGQIHGEYLLDHHELIPKEAQEYRLIFPNTVWRRSNGDRYIFFLSWYNGHWTKNWCWLGNGFYPSSRLVRPTNHSI